MFPEWWTQYPDLRLILDVAAGVSLGLALYNLSRTLARGIYGRL